MKSQKANFIYNKGEKCLLNNNIIITNKKYENKYPILEKNKIRKNKSFIKIIVEIKEYFGGGSYLITINQNYINNRLKKDKYYVVSFNLLKKCEIELLNKIKEYNNINEKNYPTNLDDDEDEEKINTSEEDSLADLDENNELKEDTPKI